MCPDVLMDHDTKTKASRPCRTSGNIHQTLYQYCPHLPV